MWSCEAVPVWHYNIIWWTVFRMLYKLSKMPPHINVAQRRTWSCGFSDLFCHIAQCWFWVSSEKPEELGSSLCFLFIWGVSASISMLHHHNTLAIFGQVSYKMQETTVFKGGINWWRLFVVLSFPPISEHLIDSLLLLFFSIPSPGSNHRSHSTARHLRFLKFFPVSLTQRNVTKYKIRPTGNSYRIIVYEIKRDALWNHGCSYFREGQGLRRVFLRWNCLKIWFGCMDINPSAPNFTYPSIESWK